MLTALVLIRVLAILLACPAVVAAETRTVYVLSVFPDSETPRPETMQWTRETAAQVDTYYAAQSFGQFAPQSDVFGIFTIERPASGLSIVDTQAVIASESQAALTSAGVDLSVYGRNFVYLTPIVNGVMAGYGDLGGVWIALLPETVAPVWFQMAAHELGHHYWGLLHANDDPYDVMTPGSQTTPVDYFSAIIRARLGWISLTTITGDGDYLVTPYDQVGGTPGIRIQDRNRKIDRIYVLEYRPYATGGALVHLTTATAEQSWPPTTGLMWMQTIDVKPATQAIGVPYCDLDARIRFTSLAVTGAGLMVRVEFRRCK